MCTAIGLGSIYLLQISWFVAWMSLDEKRIGAGGDGILPCIVHQDYQPPACSQTDYGQLIVKKYASLLSSALFKASVIIFTLGMFGFGIWGSVLIRQKFDPTLLLPSDSYLRDFLSVHDELYPNNGWTAYIYTSKFDHTDLAKFEDLTNQLTELERTNTHLGGKSLDKVFAFLILNYSKMLIPGGLS